MADLACSNTINTTLIEGSGGQRDSDFAASTVQYARQYNSRGSVGVTTEFSIAILAKYTLNFLKLSNYRAWYSKIVAYHLNRILVTESSVLVKEQRGNLGVRLLNFKVSVSRDLIAISGATNSLKVVIFI